MKKIMLLILAVFCTANLFANVIVYKTYQDYVDNKGVSYDEYAGQKEGHLTVDVSYVFKKGGEKTEIKNTDMWGLKVNDVLFRVFHNGRGSSAGRVMSTGKVTYYEFGREHIDNVNKGKPDEKIDSDKAWKAISVGLNDPICWAFFPDDKNRMNKKDQEYQKSHPEFEQLYNCIKDHSDVKIIRKCVKDFNGN